MRLLVDVNVLLDHALEREPGNGPSSLLIHVCGQVHDAYIAWHSLSIFHYILKRKGHTDASARAWILSVMSWTTVASTTNEDAVRAASLPIQDFEDAMQAASAKSASADFIISQNDSDFVNSPVPCVTPRAFLQQFHPDLLP